MAKHLIPSNATIKSIKTGDPRQRLNDGEGLYLKLFVNGGSHGWRFDYSLDGRRNTLSLGTYPATTLRGRPQASRRRTAPHQERTRSERSSQGCAREGRRPARGSKPRGGWSASAGLLRSDRTRVVRESRPELGRHARGKDPAAPRARRVSVDRQQADQVDPTGRPAEPLQARGGTRRPRDNASCPAELRAGLPVCRGYRPRRQ